MDIWVVVGIMGAALVIAAVIVALDIDLDARKARRDAYRRNHARRR